MKKITKTTVIEKGSNGKVLKETITIVEEETKNDNAKYPFLPYQPSINPYPALPQKVWY